MTWVKLTDDFADHPKILKLDKTALAVHIWGLCHCGRHLTNGFVSLGALAGCPWVSKRSALLRALGNLEGAGLWEPEDGGYRIHDFLEYNPDRDSVLKERRLKTERQARWRANKRRHVDAPVDASTAGAVDGSPDPPPKGGEGKRPAAPPSKGARLRLIEDECMRCFERKAVCDFNGKILCRECVIDHTGDLGDRLREHIETLRGRVADG